MRGLSLQQTYPLSPFTPLNERVQEGDEFDAIFEMHPTNVKQIYMVDAGLTFNSPFPLVLRPQRDIDVILSFDFSARPSDNTPPFKVLRVGRSRVGNFQKPEFGVCCQLAYSHLTPSLFWFEVSFSPAAHSQTSSCFRSRQGSLGRGCRCDGMGHRPTLVLPDTSFLFIFPPPSTRNKHFP